MAALGTFTSAADVEEVVETEKLSAFIQGFEYARPVGLSAAWARQGQGSIPVRFARWGEVTVPAGTKTESDNFADAEIASAEESITPGLVGFRFPLSDEMTVQSLGGIPASALAQAMQALVNRMDDDILASSTSATNTTGAVTDEYTLSRFRSDLGAYWALKIPAAPMGHVLTLSLDGGIQLASSLGSTAALFARQEGDTLRLGPEAGFLGSLYGVAVYASPNVPTESTGHSGMLTPIGNQASFYGIVLQEMPGVVRTRGDEAENRAVDFYHFRAWYGAGMTNRNRGLEILHQ